MENYFLIFLLALPISLFFVLHRHRRNRRPPGPPGLPLVGNLHQLNTSAPHIRLHRLSSKYGPLMSLTLGSVPAVVISSARVAKEVLKTHDLAVSGRPSMIGQQKLSYSGRDLAFSPHGDYWREVRKICMLHLFSTKKVLSFRSVREEEISRTLEKISELSFSSKPVNLSEMMMCLTNSIICRIGFGKRYEESRFEELLNETQAMLASFFVSDYFPVVGWWVDRASGLFGRLEKNWRELDLFYQKVIEEHLDPERPKPQEEDITDVLLRLRKDDFTLDHIKALLMNVLVAGTDTSAASIIWIMTQLVKNPRVMNTTQNELRNSIKKKNLINEDDLQKLPYLKAVVKEAFRLHPVAPMLVPREAIQKFTLDTYEIEPNTIILVNAWAIGRDCDAWENPEEFLPERFLESSIDFKGQDFGLIPFGTGRRLCPGMHLGVLTVELALANLLYFFDWELPQGMKKEDIDMDMIPGITMHKKIPLHLLSKKYCV
ncbi:6,7,8-trihydroxycoumarin synthase-like isoform X2 [Malania oleifera]|uniref:6,7,8-trihydroxycoumarin synthase-like isoform X2 n=1 Tax=Malania oleifera TaxID=397392 RepID=UPI0025ADEE4B|nr:6,7,8-trihydroxycoumarin synthase-like isoform X2 [Malania oleifera]